MTITREQFERTRHLALRLAGIQLVERHQPLLERRLSRSEAGGSLDYDLLLDAVDQGSTLARQRLLSLVTTRHTGFFRHPRHFDVAARWLLRVAEERGAPVQAWSAAAATGEEPYSLALRLLELAGPERVPVSILATDVSREALASARAAEYGEAAVQTLDPLRRDRFFQLMNGRRYEVGAAVRQLVTFSELNLATPPWPEAGPFEVIFCRNVLMYLEASCRPVVLEAMAQRLTPGGLLLLDPTEHVGAARGWFRDMADGVYALRQGWTSVL